MTKAKAEELVRKYAAQTERHLEGRRYYILPPLSAEERRAGENYSLQIGCADHMAVSRLAIRIADLEGVEVDSILGTCAILV